MLYARKKRENHYAHTIVLMSITEAMHPGQGAPLISQINTASVNVTHIDAYIQTFSPVDDQKQTATCHQAGALTDFLFFNREILFYQFTILNFR